MTSWFRSWHGAPTDPKWRTVAKRAGVRPGDVTALVWALLDRASQASERGSIAGYDAEVLADALGYETQEVEAILSALHEKGVLEDDKFVGWEKHQPQREDNSADRVKAYRERKALQERDETHSDDVKRNVTHCNAPEKIQIQIQNREDKKDFSAPARSKKGTRLPADWQPNPDLIATATKLGLSAAQFDREVEKFRDYWAAKPGAGGVKLDWDSTARNWLRTAAERINPAPRNAPSPQTTPTTAVWINRGTPQWQAWSKARGKEPYVTVRNGDEGAFFRSEWPQAEGVAA